MKNPIIAIVTESEYNFKKYVEDYGREHTNYVQINNQTEIMPGTVYQSVIKTHGHEDVNKTTIQRAQQKAINIKENPMVKNCNDCNYFGYEPPMHDQPYPEFWCSKGVWDGIDDTDDLLKENDCIKFKSK